MRAAATPVRLVFKKWAKDWQDETTSQMPRFCHSPRQSGVPAGGAEHSVESKVQPKCRRLFDMKSGAVVGWHLPEKGAPILVAEAAGRFVGYRRGLASQRADASPTSAGDTAARDIDAARFKVLCQRLKCSLRSDRLVLCFFALSRRLSRMVRRARDPLLRSCWRLEFGQHPETGRRGQFHPLR